MSKCNCGELLVCPKCTPIIQQTNAIIVRYKDKDYNGGMPNQLIITPCWSDGEYDRSTAVLVGDNFFQKPHWTSRTFSVQSMAKWIAESDYSYLSGVFDLSKHHKRPFQDLQKVLRDELSLTAEVIT